MDQWHSRQRPVTVFATARAEDWRVADSLEREPFVRRAGLRLLDPLDGGPHIVGLGRIRMLLQEVLQLLQGLFLPGAAQINPGESDLWIGEVARVQMLGLLEVLHGMFEIAEPEIA